MILYNIMFGFNPYARLCVAMLGVKTTAEIPRFRDAWLADDGLSYTILTRTGGPNRPHFAAENTLLKGQPDYISDRDDEFDPTFAEWTYKVPEAWQADAKIAAAFQVVINDGAEHQGVGKKMTMIETGGKRPRPDIKSDDPRVAEACDAYNRMVERAKAEGGR